MKRTMAEEVAEADRALRQLGNDILDVFRPMLERIAEWLNDRLTRN